jgi:hypothetical protein
MNLLWQAPTNAKKSSQWRTRPFLRLDVSLCDGHETTRVEDFAIHLKAKRRFYLFDKNSLFNSVQFTMKAFVCQGKFRNKRAGGRVSIDSSVPME